MSKESSFVQPAVPKFDGYYDHWAMLMENFLRSKEYWELVEIGVPAVEEGVVLSDAQKKNVEDQKLKDLKVKNYLFQALDRAVLETILNKDSAKDIWDSMKQKYQGSTRVKRAQLQALRKEFESLHMKTGESVNEYFARTLTIANKMKANGETEKKDQVVVEKILRSMTQKFDYVVCSIEESKDIDTLTIDELQSSLLVHEQRMGSHVVDQEEHALQATHGDQYGGRGRGRGNRGRGRGRGRQSFDKSTVTCWHCQLKGHFQWECPNKEKEANFVEAQEEMLLMAYVDTPKVEKGDVWFLDSGCSNHMCGKKEYFSDFDGSFRVSVKLGNDSSMLVLGKGNVRFEVNGIAHVITEVFYVPELKNNLLSIGQLQEKGLTVLFKHGKCQIFHPERGFIMDSKMSSNRMFVLRAMSLPATSACFSTIIEDTMHLWHCRFGHLSFKGLNTLQQRQMVNGLPHLKPPLKLCKDCLVGKQHRDSFPKKSPWRASDVLQLVHADICGPITPNSNSKKRQLTAAYTPQQNGVAERKNRTIMNMVRSMLSEKKIPKTFWPEAVNWTVHVLNRSPTLAVKIMTPEEAWSGVKPSVGYFRVFGCIAHVHVPDNKRKKLDDKSISCILLGVSEESKAYRLYDPISQRIIISRDVVFEEDKSWDWEKKFEEDVVCELEWGDFEEQACEHDENGEPSEADVGAEQRDEANPSTQEISSGSNVGRNRRAPIWMRDYESGEGLSEDDNEALFALFATADPINFEEAVKSEKWRNAMDVEMEAIERNGTWELTDLPKDGKKIGVKWVYKTKLNENGEVDKFKARLVAKGYTQQHGVDYTEVFAPVARMETIRLVVALAAQKGWGIYQLDVKSAFLHGELNEEVFVEQPCGYVQKGNEQKVYRLKKALYGLKQAPRAWYSRIEAYFVKEGFEKCEFEHTLFIKTGKEGAILIVSLYVDDLIFTGNNELMFEWFKHSMKSEFDMTDLGKMRYFLGLEVLQRPDGVFISQRKYALEVLRKFEMDESNCVQNPIVPGFKLAKDEGGDYVNKTFYKQLVGSLMYVTATRPDLMFVVSLLSRYMENPTKLHLQAAKRVLRYLQGTTDFGIFYKKGGDDELVAYSDSDYAGDLDDRKSTSGYVFLFSSGAISWSSKKQPIVSLSTTEAEFIAAASCACQAVWLQRVLDMLSLNRSKSITIHCDNSSAIKLSKNPVMHGRTKHIDVRFHFLRNLTKDGTVELEYCSSEEQLADLMTKPLKLDSFCKLRQSLGVCSEASIN